MHHLDPVASCRHRESSLSSSTAERTIPASRRAPVAGSPGLSRSTKGTPSRVRLLVALERRHDLVGLYSRIELGGEPAPLEQPGHLGPKLARPGEPERGDQPQGDRLAMAVAAVARGRLDRVTDGVAEVQDLPATRVALVLGDDVDLHTGAVEDEVAELCGVERLRARGRAPRASPPAISAVFTTSAKPAASSSGGSVASAPGSARTACGHVVGADVVLRLRQVHAGLPAVRGIDLRDKRGRGLDDGHAALVGRSAEPGEVADHAAAEREHPVVAPRPGAGELTKHALRLGDRLRRLVTAGLDRLQVARQPPAWCASAPGRRRRTSAGRREQAQSAFGDDRRVLPGSRCRPRELGASQRAAPRATRPQACRRARRRRSGRRRRARRRRGSRAWNLRTGRPRDLAPAGARCPRTGSRRPPRRSGTRRRSIAPALRGPSRTPPRRRRATPGRHRTGPRGPGAPPAREIAPRRPPRRSRRPAFRLSARSPSRRRSQRPRVSAAAPFAARVLPAPMKPMNAIVGASEPPPFSGAIRCAPRTP